MHTTYTTYAAKIVNKLLDKMPNLILKSSLLNSHLFEVVDLTFLAIYFFKVSSGAFHRTCLRMRMESSEASVRVTCLFQIRDGCTLFHVQDLQGNKVRLPA